MENILLNTDSYKFSHFQQYPPGTEIVHSYIESRGGRYQSVLFFGLQMFLKEYLSKPFTRANVLEACDLAERHGLPFNREGWDYILRNHNGYLPVEIRAVEEGEVVPVSNVLVTMENTDPNVPWLTNFLETALVRAVWYPTTVATHSHEIKKLIYGFMQETSDSPLKGLEFKLHDFGARGVSSFESAGIGGLAHLVNFKGTDTVSAVSYGRKYYNEEMAGFSIPAAEHSTITSWGRSNEKDAYKSMLDQFGGEGKMVAVVSDSYDIYNSVNNIWGVDLKDQVMGLGGTVVIRPDSGIPWEVAPDVVRSLYRSFGGFKNKKGYLVLNDAVRVIQGDGVNEGSIRKILEKVKEDGFSADNIAFGMGGALLQGLDRDTQQFAMKCSAIRRNGKWEDVWKEPVTDADMSFKKRSKPGRLTLIYDNKEKEFKTVRSPISRGIFNPDSKETWDSWEAMSTVYKDGEILRDVSLDGVRSRAFRYIQQQQ